MIKDKYKELEIYMNKDDADRVNEIFKEILEEAFKIINNKIENKKSFDISNEEDLYAVRAMFEYMLELWDEGSLKEAREVGYDMLYLVDDKKLKEMFSMFVIGMLAGLSLDEFFEKYVKLDSLYKDFFFVDFNDEIDELVIKYQDKFKEEFSE